MIKITIYVPVETHMGGTKSKLTVDFTKVCHEYKNIVQAINASSIFSNENPELISLIDKYIAKKDSSEETKLIWAIHKLHPLDYDKKDPVDRQWLINACLRQALFCRKIAPLLKSYNKSQWIREYIAFLKLYRDHKGRVLVPTLKQDFIWHAHMQDHEAYIRDTQRIVGFILNHDDDIPEDKLLKFSKETEEIKKSQKAAKAAKAAKTSSIPDKPATPPSYSTNTDDTYYPVYIAPVAVYSSDNYDCYQSTSDNKSNCGGGASSCGSSCGGGGGGGSSCGGGGSSCGGGGGGGGCD